MWKNQIALRNVLGDPWPSVQLDQGMGNEVQPRPPESFPVPKRQRDGSAGTPRCHGGCEPVRVQGASTLNRRGVAVNAAPVHTMLTLALPGFGAVADGDFCLPQQAGLLLCEKGSNEGRWQIDDRIAMVASMKEVSRLGSSTLTRSAETARQTPPNTLTPAFNPPRIHSHLLSHLLSLS